MKIHQRRMWMLAFVAAGVIGVGGVSVNLVLSPAPGAPRTRVEEGMDAATAANTLQVVAGARTGKDVRVGERVGVNLEQGPPTPMATASRTAGNCGISRV